MAYDSYIKVYNKEDKIKLLAYETSSLKIINIHKYDGEIEYRHSFTIHKDEKVSRFIKNGDKYEKIEVNVSDKKKNENITYYDLVVTKNGFMIEQLYYTDRQSEHWELVGDQQEITTTKVFKSGNVYEKKITHLDGEIYKVGFTNGNMTSFGVPMQESKINEYLKILKDE